MPLLLMRVCPHLALPRTCGACVHDAPRVHAALPLQCILCRALEPIQPGSSLHSAVRCRSQHGIILQGAISCIVLRESGARTECASASTDGSCILWDWPQASAARALQRPLRSNPSPSTLTAASWSLWVRLRWCLRGCALPACTACFQAPTSALLPLSVPLYNEHRCPPPPKALKEPGDCRAWRVTHTIWRAAGTDRKISYWDAYNGTAIRILEPTTSDSLGWVAVSSSGSTLVTGAPWTALHSWHAGPGRCCEPPLQRACPHVEGAGWSSLFHT